MNPLVERKQSPQTNSWKLCNIVTCGCFFVRFFGVSSRSRTHFTSRNMHERPGFSHTFFRFVACRDNPGPSSFMSVMSWIGNTENWEIIPAINPGLYVPGSKLLYNGQINPCCWVDEFIPYHNGKNGEFRPQCYICLYREFSMTALACLDQFLQMFCRTWFVSMQPHIPSRRRNWSAKSLSVTEWSSHVLGCFVYRYPVIPPEVKRV